MNMKSFILKNFEPSELRCKCCGSIILTDNSIEAHRILQKTRDIYSRPIDVNCGTRCPNYNTEIPDASKSSEHMKGLAFDLTISSPTIDKLMILIDCARQAGFTYIRLYKKRLFIHVAYRKGFKYLLRELNE